VTRTATARDRHGNAHRDAGQHADARVPDAYRDEHAHDDRYALRHADPIHLPVQPDPPGKYRTITATHSSPTSTPTALRPGRHAAGASSASTWSPIAAATTTTGSFTTVVSAL
jgi:hypothetical protein